MAYDSAELADLLRKHGGKTGEELKAEGKWNLNDIKNKANRANFRNRDIGISYYWFWFFVDVFRNDWNFPTRLPQGQWFSYDYILFALVYSRLMDC